MFNPAMTNASGTIKTITFASETPGPRLLVLGGVHGNEICGPIAIRRALEEFESGALSLQRGRVTFIPVCNPEAARRNVRYIERNLNRFLVPTEDPQTYEARLGNVLCPILEDCDVLLDLHSYDSGDVPFVFVNSPEDPRERGFADCLGPEHLVTGWENAYAAAGRKPPENPDEPTGTAEYARRFGVVGVTTECGQHLDPQAPEVAYRAIRNAMHYLGLADFPGGRTGEHKTRLVRACNVVYRQQEGTFAKDWKNLVELKQGELIGTYPDGTRFHADRDGFIIMPHATQPIGAEWYYYGTE